MPRVLKKIEFKITKKIEDGKSLSLSTDFNSKHFINVGNFTGFMQYYGIGSEITVSEYDGKIGIGDSKINKN
jgi:hypothetical protein